MFNLVVLNCVLCISSARWCIKPVNTLSISFFKNDYWWWYNYSLQLAAIYHFEFHPKDCFIFGCSPGGERKIFWQPHPPLHPHIYLKFLPGLWPHPPHFFRHEYGVFSTVGTLPPHFFHIFSKSFTPPPHFILQIRPSRATIKKWNRPKFICLPPFRIMKVS